MDDGLEVRCFVLGDIDANRNVGEDIFPWVFDAALFLGVSCGGPEVFVECDGFAGCFIGCGLAYQLIAIALERFYIYFACFEWPEAAVTGLAEEVLVVVCGSPFG